MLIWSILREALKHGRTWGFRDGILERLVAYIPSPLLLLLLAQTLNLAGSLTDPEPESTFWDLEPSSWVKILETTKSLESKALSKP